MQTPQTRNAKWSGTMPGIEREREVILNSTRAGLYLSVVFGRCLQEFTLNSAFVVDPVSMPDDANAYSGTLASCTLTKKVYYYV